MDSFLITLVFVTMAEMGDRTQLLCAVLAMRFRNDKLIIAGLCAATVINCALSVYLGHAFGDWLSVDALKLFTSIAYILAGIGMLMLFRPLDILENWKIGAFATSFIGIFILQIGDKSQFMIGANSANADYWLFPFFGAVVGILLVNIPAIIFKDKLSAIIPITIIRKICGVIILLWGVVMAMSALRIIA